jgi:hypothetical protein
MNPGRRAGRPHRPTRPPQEEAGCLRTKLCRFRFGTAAKTPGVLIFMSGHQPEKIAVGFGLKRFYLAAVVAQADSGKDAQAAAA